MLKALIPNTKASGNHIGIMHAGALFCWESFLRVNRALPGKPTKVPTRRQRPEN